MRDHRVDHDPTEVVEITERVHQHSTKHPGSVRRSSTAAARAAAKRAKASRKRNR